MERRDQVVELLREAVSALNEAARQAQVQEDGSFLSTEEAMLIGGFSQAVESYSNLLEEQDGQ